MADLVRPILPRIRYHVEIRLRRIYKCTKGFANYAKFKDHCKHIPRYYPGLSEMAYARRADELWRNPKDAAILEFQRSDGDTIRFDTRNGDFGVLTPKRRIRTLFRPPAGFNYYNRKCI
jgi:hypothetical protein